jgi:hypothetical protein
LITKFTGAIFVFPNGQTQTELFTESGLVVKDQPFDTEINLGGGFVFPAFRDGHCHPLFAGREADGPLVSKAKSIQEIQKVLSDYKKSNPNRSWIEGGAYDRSIIADGRFLASWIDEVVSEVPVVLHASDHHTIWVNSKALELIGERLPKLASGSVDQDPTGTPTGVLREPEAMALVLDKAPIRTLEQEMSALIWADKQLASLGIVFAQDAWITKGMTDVYIEAVQQEELLLDYNLAFKIEPASWQQSIDSAVAERAKVTDLANSSLSAKTVKFFADGVFGSSTASVLEPYLDDASFGEPLWSKQDLNAACLKAQELGFQLHIHAIGDAGVRQSLDAIEFVQSKLGVPTIPNVIAHAELIDDKDLNRFAELSVIANMQPLWAQADGMLMSCQPRLGSKRLDSLYRMRDLVDSGAVISFGSDWPVSSADPLLGIATSVTRQTADGEPSGGWMANQSLVVREALDNYSAKVVLQIYGSQESPLSIGSDCDFLVLSGNILTSPDNDIRSLKVLATYKSAKRIY